MQTSPASTEHPQYLTFAIGTEEYGLGILRVREIIQHGAVTRVPGTPAWVRGVINLRGSVVPVLDLAVKFGLPPSPITRSTCIVITEVALEDESVVLGVVADEVSQVVELPPSGILPPPSFGTRVRVAYLLGMGRVGERLVLLLDADKMLSAEEVALAAEIEVEPALGEDPETAAASASE
jgi:purine-binding chemotaxis protein CheW